MSLYLGKIHYWLFNKILWFKDLEVEFVDLAKAKGINEKDLLNKLTNLYGDRVEDKPLEELIDTSNIHGWLQKTIIISENRLAEVIDDLKKINVKDEEIKEIFKNQGNKAANEVLKNKEVNTAIEIYNSLNDYILDGMPCDRVNELVISEENKVVWKRRLCVHKDIWNKANIKVDYFYEIRDEFIKEFVTILNSKYVYKKLSEDEMVIETLN